MLNLKYAFLTKELLEDLYNNKRLSIVDISKIFRIDRGTVSKYMKIFNIKPREQSHAGYLKSIKYNINDRYFKYIDTNNKSYIFGFLLGDGYVNYDRIKISIAISDSQILNDIASELNADYYISYSKAQKSSWQDKINLSFRRSVMVDDLKSHGFVLSPKTSFEEFYAFDNIEFTWSFIRGMFDADGCVRVYDRKVNNKIYNKYKLSITTGKKFCLGLKRFIEDTYNVSLPNKCVRKKSGSNVYVFEVASKSILELFRDNMYNDGIYLLRKKQIFNLI